MGAKRELKRGSRRCTQLVKFRYVLLILAGLVLALVIVCVKSMMNSTPDHFAFLGANRPREVRLVPDPVGLVGREARYYVLHEQAHAVANQAQSELSQTGWKETGGLPAVFTRGKHESIDIESASSCTDPKLIEGIPHAQLSSFTVVKILNPRMPPAIRMRVVHWVRHPFRGLFHAA